MDHESIQEMDKTETSIDFDTAYDLRAAILQHALRRRDRGDTLISPKGNLLNWLIDLRPLLLQRRFLIEVCKVFWETHKSQGSFQLAGIETAAVPLVAALVLSAPDDRRNINAFIIRKDRKTTGLGNVIEGEVTGDAKVVYIFEWVLVVAPFSGCPRSRRGRMSCLFRCIASELIAGCRIPPERIKLPRRFVRVRSIWAGLLDIAYGKSQQSRAPNRMPLPEKDPANRD